MTPSKGNSVNADNTRAATGPVMRAHPWPPDMRLLDRLPHRDWLPLESDEAAPRAVRRRIAKLLPEWGLAEFEVVASLVASELVTNAVVATRAVAWRSAPPPVRLWLRGGPGVLAILAWDATLAAPVPREAAVEDESGRGLAIVATLSADCGFYYPRERYGGKVTWSMIRTP